MAVKPLPKSWQVEMSEIDASAGKIRDAHALGGRSRSWRLAVSSCGFALI
jgi:hypothetical protein